MVQPTNESVTTSTFSDHDPTQSVKNIDSLIIEGAGPFKAALGAGVAILIWLASVVLQFALSLLLLIPYAVYRGPSISSADYGKALTEFALGDRTAVFLQVFALLPAHLLTLVLIWGLITRFGKRPFWTTVGLDWRGGLEFWVCVGLGIVMFGFGLGLAKIFGGDTPTQLEQIINSSLPTRYLVAFLAVATAPLTEELIYRGVLFSAFRRAVGVVGAVILVLLLFTIIHVPQYWPNYGVIMAVGLLSVSLTILRAYTNRLLPCVVVHLVFNAIQAVLLILQPLVEKNQTQQNAAAGLFLSDLGRLFG